MAEPNAGGEAVGYGWRKRLTKRWPGLNRHFLVYVLIASATFGAYAIWEATDRGNLSGDAYHEIEFTSILHAERKSAISELIAYDLRLLPRYGAALYGRETSLGEAMWEMAGAFEAERRVLRAFFSLATPSESDVLAADRVIYNTDLVEELYDAASFERLSQRIVGLEADVKHHLRLQRSLLWAALLFAVSIASCTFADLAERRVWFEVWAALGILLLITGGILVVLNAWQRLWVVGVAFALFVVLRLGIEHLLGVFGRRTVSWYAELAGALTIISLTAVVVLLTHAGGQERRALNEARLFTIDASHQLLTDQQAALDDLDAAILVESLRARTQADGVDGGPLSRVPGRVLDLLETGIEGSASERGVRVSDLNARLPVGGFLFVGHHVAQSARPSLALSARGELHRVDSAFWGKRVAQLTIALVVLGLAAYMFSLAADETRHRLIAGWVLSTGAVGLVLGAVLASLTAAEVIHAAGSDADDQSTAFREVADAYADGRVALLSGECDRAIREFDRAIEGFEAEFDTVLGFRAAFIDRAVARNCDVATAGVYAPAMPPTQLDAFLEDVTQAANDEFDNELLLGMEGWGTLLKAFADPTHFEEASAEAAELTGRALFRDPTNPYYLFNAALIHLARGDEITAENAYRLAARCVLYKVDPESPDSCSGAARLDNFLPAAFAVQALGDLEMLGHARGLDVTRFKELAITLLSSNEPSTGAEPPEITLERLDVYSQKLQLIVEAVPEGDASIVWYYRPNESVPWGVLWDSTIATFTHARFNQPLDAFIALPRGDYRAEVFIDGRLVGSAQASRGYPAGTRYTWHDLGLAAILSGTWEEVAAQQGFWREYSYPEDPTRSLAVVRLEGWPAPTEEFPLTRLLDYLTESAFDNAGEGADGAETYFLGVDRASIASRLYDNGKIWAAVAFSAYCESEDSPGTILAMWIEGEEPPEDPWRTQIRESLLPIGGDEAWLKAGDCNIDSEQDFAADDTFKVLAGRPTILAIYDNDSAFVDPSTVLVVDEPAHGVVSVDDQGAVTYTAERTFTGDDQFTYDVCNSTFEVCDFATVRVMVLPVNIVNAIHAPTAPGCRDNTASASNWTVLGMPEPVEVWRCDYIGHGGANVDLYAEYLRFQDTATANQWADLQVGRQSSPSDLLIDDTTWHYEGGPTLGRLREWVSGSGDPEFAITLWVYESEAIVAFAWATTGDHAAVREWWTDNA